MAHVAPRWAKCDGPVPVANARAGNRADLLSDLRRYFKAGGPDRTELFSASRSFPCMTTGGGSGGGMPAAPPAMTGLIAFELFTLVPIGRRSAVPGLAPNPPVG